MRKAYLLLLLILGMGAVGCDSELAPIEPAPDLRPQIVDVLGVASDAPGQFVRPHGIASDAAGFLYVADQGNSRIQKLDPNGAVVDIWPLPFAPTSLDANRSGAVAVTGSTGTLDPNAQVALLNSSGEIVWQRPIEAGVVFAADVAIRGIVAVLDDKGTIRTYSLAGSPLNTWRESAARIIDIAPGNMIHVLTLEEKQIFRSDGQLANWIHFDFDACSINLGDGADIDAEGKTYYFTDYCAVAPASELRVINAIGQLTNSISMSTTVRGLELVGPESVVLSRRESRSIIKATIGDGEFADEWLIGDRSAPGIFIDPVNLAVSSSGKTAVVQSNRVHVFAADGLIETAFDLPLTGKSVAFDGQDRLLVGMRYQVGRYVGDQLESTLNYRMGPHAHPDWVGEIDGVVYQKQGSFIWRPDSDLPLIDVGVERMSFHAAAITPEGEFLLAVGSDFEGGPSELRVYRTDGTLSSRTEPVLTDVRALTFDGLGRLYVATEFSISEINREGMLVRTIEIEDLPSTSSMAVDESGVLSLLDERRELVYRIRL